MLTPVHWDPVPPWTPSLFFQVSWRKKRPEEDLTLVSAPWVTGHAVSASHFRDPAPRAGRQLLRVFPGLWALCKALAQEKRKGSFAGAPLVTSGDLGSGKGAQMYL